MLLKNIMKSCVPEVPRKILVDLKRPNVTTFEGKKAKKNKKESYRIITCNSN